MKAHLYNVPEPETQWGGEMIALCGAYIKNAQMVFMWDAAFIGRELSESMNSLNICKACVVAEKPHQYVYGVLPVEEARKANEAA